MDKIISPNPIELVNMLTSDTPFATKIVVDPSDERSHDQARYVTARIEQPDLDTIRITEIFVPGIECLKSSDQGSVV